MVIEDRMLGNRPLWRPRSGTLDTLIIIGGWRVWKYKDRGSLKRIWYNARTATAYIYMAEHLRENVELSVTHFETSLNTFHRPW